MSAPVEARAIADGTQGTAQATISAALNDADPTRAHRRIFWLICTALFVDFYDLTMGGAIAATLLRQGWSTLALNSMFFSAAGLGAALGVFAAGILADRVGRVRVLQYCLALMTVGTLLCAMAPSMEFLIAARVIAAIGMGGIPTIGYVYLSEVLPARVRGAWISAAGIVVAASSTAASIVALYLLPMGAWRMMFVLPTVGGLLLIAALALLPESPRWLAARNKLNEAVLALRKITLEQPAIDAPMAQAPAAAAASAHAPLPHSLFRAPVLQRLILAAGLAIAATVVSNSVVAWLPTILLVSGTVERGLGDNLVIMLGAPLGSLLGYFIVGRVRRRVALVATSLLASGLAIACAFVGRDAGLIPLAFVLMALINLACTIILGIYLPELFPTSVRARGSSFALTLGRLALIGAPFVMAALLSAYGRMGVMLGIAACLSAIVLLTISLGVETAEGSFKD